MLVSSPVQGLFRYRQNTETEAREAVQASATQSQKGDFTTRECSEVWLSTVSVGDLAAKRQIPFGPVNHSW